MGYTSVRMSIIIEIRTKFLIFEERSKLNIKTWTVIRKLLYCDHFAYFVLKFCMFRYLLFTNRTYWLAIHNIPIAHLNAARY